MCPKRWGGNESQNPNRMQLNNNAGFFFVGSDLCCSFRGRCAKVTNTHEIQSKQWGGFARWMLRQVAVGPASQPVQIQQGSEKECRGSLQRKVFPSVTHQFILGLGSLREQQHCLLGRRYKGLRVTCVAVGDEGSAAPDESRCSCVMLRLLEAFVRVAGSSAPTTLSD